MPALSSPPKFSLIVWTGPGPRAPRHNLAGNVAGYVTEAEAQDAVKQANQVKKPVEVKSEAQMPPVFDNYACVEMSF